MPERSVKRMTLDEMEERMAIRPPEFVRTGLLAFDLLFEGKGLPLGGLFALHAPSSSGKTTLTLTLCKLLADRGHRSVFAMSEPSPQLAEDMGLLGEAYRGKFAMLDLTTYDELEDLFNSFMESDATLLVVDSLTACSLSSVAQQQIRTNETLPAADSRAKAALLKMVQSNLKRSSKAVICIQQQRANFNAGWGDLHKSVMAGGRAEEFYTSAIIELVGAAQIRASDTATSAVLGTSGYLVCNPKNRFAPPRVPSFVQIIFGKGASNIKVIRDFMKWAGMLKASGSWFTVRMDGEGDADGDDDESVTGCERVNGKTALNEWIADHYDELEELFYSRAQDYFNGIREGYRPS